MTKKTAKKTAKKTPARKSAVVEIDETIRRNTAIAVDRMLYRPSDPPRGIKGDAEDIGKILLYHFGRQAHEVVRLIDEFLET